MSKERPTQQAFWLSTSRMKSPVAFNKRITSLSPNAMNRNQLMSMMKKYTFKSPNQQRIKSPKNSCRRPVFTNQWNSKRFHFDLEKAKRRLKNLPDLSKKLGNLPGNTIVEEFKMAKLEPSSKHEKVPIYYGLLNLKLDSIII